MSGTTPCAIEVLVLTYNRAPLLAATIESLLAQSHPASRICVLDNGSSDDTAQVVRSFAGRGVELVCRGSNDPRACWSDLQDMARGPWTMLFHDDDLLHPDYLRDLSAALVNEPHATVAVSAMRVHRDPENVGWERVRSDRYRNLTARQLAALLYGGFPMPFCSAVYRTDVLRQGRFEYETYGKIADRPFVIDAAKAGSALVMLDRYVKYRSHDKQDSADQATGPFLPEIFALQRYYRQLLGERLSDAGGRIFLRRNYVNLLREFERLNRNAAEPMSQEEFFQRAIEAKAASPRSLRFGACYSALTQISKRIERGVKSLVRRNPAA
ncbi:glycosyl transferase family 2 [Geobacter sp. OR-1]|uniref:glycosyltransferase family A protein n=1 Tax=Geobacter sp. OR-1 TaxID=1266765 RepID=UPI000542F426|nr:glycosyltransferase family 2 protein [Geobacter sp. OR-1]GAM07925.1 glycosyl transferase family 2 [Geobacter sp. OR-1]